MHYIYIYIYVYYTNNAFFFHHNVWYNLYKQTNIVTNVFICRWKWVPWYINNKERGGSGGYDDGSGGGDFVYL